MSILFACMYNMHAWCLQRSEESFGFPKTRVMDDCELPCGCWESNSDTLQKQVPLNRKSISPAQGFIFIQLHNSTENVFVISVCKGLEKLANSNHLVQM